MVQRLVSFDAMSDGGKEKGGLAGQMLEILIAGVSTRCYEHVILEKMAETVGVSKRVPNATSRRSTSWPSGSMEFSLAHTTLFAP